MNGVLEACSVPVYVDSSSIDPACADSPFPCPHPHGIVPISVPDPSGSNAYYLHVCLLMLTNDNADGARERKPKWHVGPANARAVVVTGPASDFF